jgi:hypothetical protein
MPVLAAHLLGTFRRRFGAPVPAGVAPHGDTWRSEGAKVAKERGTPGTLRGRDERSHVVPEALELVQLVRNRPDEDALHACPREC